MCGLYFSQSSFEINDVNIDKIISLINVSIKKKKYLTTLNYLRKLRCNKFLIELQNNLKLTKKIQNLKKKLIENKKKINSEIFYDLIWCIENEIIQNSENVFCFIKKNKIQKNLKSIIFINYLFKSIESLNYLETRGRDSASISINIKSKTKIKLNQIFKINNSNFLFDQKKINKNDYLINITLKYANQVGYSGENLLNLKNTLINSKILNKINFEKITGFFIIGHTRWASTGSVNLSNCHPLINVNKKENSYFYMNGDINNYLELKKNKNSILKDRGCDNDLSCLPNLFLNKNKISNKLLRGSYVLFYHSSNEPNYIHVFKKGSQGLYISYNNDGDLIISSDVYGVVNFSDKFKRLNKDKHIKINTFDNKIKLFPKERENTTIISTRDLDKKNFERFFTKEVDDTQTFLERTIDNHLNLEKMEIKNMDNIFPKRIVQKLKNNKIKNIIITGMGSCYTAAVGISKYLSNLLIKNGNYEMKVQATIASEGSGFYLSKDMSDSIVIVIAQSGTTIDTNVFAKLAKIRGAYTLALANKRDGDITYIVENCLYLGNGRDVELSVPSTKTYTCHLFLGFVLSEKISLYLFNKVSKNIFQISKDIKKNLKIKRLINFHSQKINKINFNVFKYINWIVLFDDSSNSYNALEFRIKLSECCYKSLLFMHTSKFKQSNFKNCLIFYVGENKMTEYSNKEDSNYFISISSKFNKSKKLTQSILLKSKEKSMIAIESALAIQMIAFRISKLIDKSKNENNNKIKEKEKINFLFNKHDIIKFNKLDKKEKEKILFEKLKRPIDAIKHQAKTVTVGAIRENIFQKKINNLKKINSTNHEKIFNGKILNLKNNVNLISKNNFEIEKYFFCNLIEYYNNKYNKKIFYNFYNPNIKTKISDSFSNIYFGDNYQKMNSSDTVIPNKKVNSEKLIIEYLKNDKNNILNYKNFLFAKKEIQYETKAKSKIKKYINNYKNIKFLGSGINYLVAKKYAQELSMKYNKSIGYDVIENHKHIDISSESLLFIFASNIYREGFQVDVVSEVEKFIAHDNKPVIFTNYKNDLFDKFSKKKIDVIKLPIVEELYSFSIFDFFFNTI